MILRRGVYNSEEVRELQRQINTLRQYDMFRGLDLPELQDDGDYGPQTEAAVRALQSYARGRDMRDSRGRTIMLDGEVGRQTRELVETLILEGEQRRLEEERRRLEEASQGQKSTSLITAFIDWLAGLAGPEQNAPNFGDATTPEEAEAARAEYEGGRREREAREYPDGRREVVRRIVRDPRVTDRDWQRLEALRESIERANGGVTVEAIAPVRGAASITSHYGNRRDPFTGHDRHHDGVDIINSNLDVLAPMPGIVVFAGNRRDGYGNVIEIIDIYGHRHRLAHLKSMSVELGEVVEQGQAIGVMGKTGRATGIHLHYEQFVGGRRVEPRFLGRDGWEPGDTIAANRNAEFMASLVRPQTQVTVGEGSQPNGTAPEDANSFNLGQALEQWLARVGIRLSI